MRPIEKNAEDGSGKQQASDILDSYKKLAGPHYEEVKTKTIMMLRIMLVTRMWLAAKLVACSQIVCLSPTPCTHCS